MSSHFATPPIWGELAEGQHGAVSRRQLLELGLTAAQAYRHVHNGRWQPLLPGVFATFTGPVQPVTEVWAAVLYAGLGAAASHSTALWLAGLLDELPRPLHVSIAHRRRVRPQPGVRIHRSTALNDQPGSAIHPAARPPRLRIEDAVLDQAARSSPTTAVDLLLRATQRRLTTATRLRTALENRQRQRFQRAAAGCPR